MEIKQSGLDMKSLIEIDPKIKCKEVCELLEMPVVIRVNDFDDKDADEFSKLMSKAHRTGQPVIPVIIDSYGGLVYSLLAMIEDIRSSRLPVATICMGKAMSCGSILLSCGSEGMRYCAPHSHIMIHDVSAMKFGKNEELQASARQIDKLQKQVFHLMAKNCGQEDDYFLKILHEKSHAEWYLTAAEAKKHRIVNHVKVPEFKVSVKVDIAFG